MVCHWSGSDNRQLGGVSVDFALLKIKAEQC